jgi:hypothetical protein
MKVHFAGSDEHRADQILIDYGINYRLNSYYYLKKKKDFNPWFLNQFAHSIVDSGLFTLMFGSGSKNAVDEKSLIKWMNGYIDWINRHHWNHVSFVECDVQKKLSSEMAWELRREMKARVKNQTVINVYHLEDGNPDDLIQFADYIAISLPELRFNVSEKERFQITKYIATKATLKGKRVHLLGCTEKEYLEYFHFCFSCDSTSWLAPLRYGEIKSKALFNTSVKDLEMACGKDTTRVKGARAFIAQRDYIIQSGNQY